MRRSLATESVSDIKNCLRFVEYENMGGGANLASITASNPQNYGMYSVDLAAKKFFSGLGMKSTFFLAQPRKKSISKYIPKFNLYKMTFGEIHHRRLRSASQLEGFSHVIYWDDFLNNPRYGREDFSPADISNGHSATIGAAFTRWSEVFALSKGRPAACILAFGGSFQHSFDEAEKEILRTFLRNVDFIAPRDPVSFENLCALSSNTAMVSQGMDCAFLLPPDAAQMKAENHFCYQFGRSSLTGTDALIQSIARMTGLEAVGLPNCLHLKPHCAAMATFASSPMTTTCH